MHLFYDQNASFDGFQYDAVQGKELIESAKNHFKKQDLWLLSRLESLVNASTLAYSQAKYQEAARAVEKFLIDDLSQTYVPIIRSDLWEEGEESKNRRKAIYSLLGFVLLNCDKMLHPISPFLTEYLASKTFGVESLMLEDWPEPEGSFRNDKLEVEFDILAKMVSLTNAARMKAKVKRRWPLKKAYYLASEDVRDLIRNNKNLLLEQTNVAEIELQTDPGKTPIQVSAKPNYELVAPRAREKMNEVAARIAQANPVALFNSLQKDGKAKLPGLADFELSPSDVEFSFTSSQPNFAVTENYGIVVALDTSRDEGLIAQGMVRDLARNLQAIRKEKGYNPTDVLDVAVVAGLSPQICRNAQTKGIGTFFPGSSEGRETHVRNTARIQGLEKS